MSYDFGGATTPIPGQGQLYCLTHGIQWSVDGETGALRVPGICKLCRDEQRGGTVTTCPIHGSQPVDLRFPGECIVCVIKEGRNKPGGQVQRPEIAAAAIGPRPPDYVAPAVPAGVAPSETTRQVAAGKRRVRRGVRRGGRAARVTPTTPPAASVPSNSTKVSAFAASRLPGPMPPPSEDDLDPLKP